MMAIKSKYKFLVVFALSFDWGCATQHAPISNAQNLKDFIVPKALPAKADSEIIYDKEFRLKIPQGLENTSIGTGGIFSHLLHFNDEQKIVILFNYKPAPMVVVRSMHLNLSKKDFLKLIENANLTEEVKHYPMLNKRRFGIIRTSSAGVYTIYLNVKKLNVATFNSSVSSLQFN